MSETYWDKTDLQPIDGTGDTPVTRFLDEAGYNQLKQEIHSEFANLPIVSNPNLLDNSYFVDPINQRGQTEYRSNGYTIDRWYIMGPLSVKITENDIEVSNIGNESGYFNQNRELREFLANSGDLITNSAFIRAEGSAVLYCGYNTSDAFTVLGDAQVPVTGDFTVISYGYVVPSSIRNTIIVAQCFCIRVDPGATVYIKAVKSELGDRQTLAHQDSSGKWVLNDPPPNGALELAKCQRYYEESVWCQDLASPASSSEISFVGTYFFGAKKRQPPAITTQSPAYNQEVTAYDLTSGVVLTGLNHVSPIAYNMRMFSPRIQDPENRFVVGHVYQVIIPDHAYSISADL